jgi:iron complex transport system substrate-binding protein
LLATVSFDRLQIQSSQKPFEVSLLIMVYHNSIFSRLFLIFSLILALSGCSNRSPATVDNADSRKVVKDELGNDVAIKPNPQRIVSLAPNITETLFALGLGPQVVGVTTYCTYPEEAKKVTRVGDTLRPNLEQIIALRPDLVLVSTASQLEEFRAKLYQAGIPVFAVKSVSIEEIFTSIETIGQITNREAQAGELVLGLRKRLNAVMDRVANKQRPKVLFIVGTEPLITAGRGAFITDIIKLAGGDSITADLPTDWPAYSTETAIAKAPEVIILPGLKHGNQEPMKLPEGLQVTPAAREGRTYNIDDELILRPGPRIIDGLEQMSKLFHPEVAP